LPLPEADKLAIAARLHVLLRRKTGRVTDTEWMAVNAEYAAGDRAFCQGACQRAQEEDVAELAAWSRHDLDHARPC
jgi:hypothetical protein